VLAGSPVKLRRLVPEVEAIGFRETLEWMLVG
jgi:hypothetical protein